MLKRESDAALLERLYKEHYTAVYKLAKRTLYPNTSLRNNASDVAQDVFAIAAKRVDVLREHPNPVGWLLKVTRYVCREYIRKRSKRKEDLFETMDLHPAREDAFAVCDLTMSLKQMLDSKEYALLQAYCLEKRPIEEISRETGASENLLRVRIHRLRKYLSPFFVFCVIFAGICNI